MFFASFIPGKTPELSFLEFVVAVDLDAVLLDRVFQPCVDAAARWASCFGLARAALVLAVESQALTLFWDAIGGATAADVALAGGGAALTVLGARQAWGMIMRAERQSRAGTMNARRIGLRRQRITWLAVAGGCACVLAPQADIKATFAMVGCAGWVALIYFVSCTPPPARHRAGRLTPGFARASG